MNDSNPESPEPIPVPHVGAPPLGVGRSALNVERSRLPDAAISAPVDRDNPWPGLAPFTEEQQALFFGRDAEARELVRRLERKTLTVLFGQSGLGKSSLLQAGVFPRLRAAGYCPIYLRLDHDPLSAPLAEQLKTAELRVTSAAGSWTKPGSAMPGETLWEFFHHRDDRLQAPDGTLVIPVIVIDQFEELFTLAQADDAARARARLFLSELADLVENRPPAAFEARLDSGTGGTDVEAYDFSRNDYRVLISLREDYLPHLESLKTSMPSLMQNRVRLTRLSGEPALDAVLKPAPGIVSPAVAEAIVAYVAGRVDLAAAEVEPALLSLVCRELNFRRLAVHASEIDASLLAGSRDTILTEFYERALADQPPAVRIFIEDELLTDSGYRETIALERARKRLIAAGADPAALDVLVSRRLLRFEERLDLRRIELTHDVLCGVVRASRDARLAREAREREERRLHETEAALTAARVEQVAGRRQVTRARMIAAGCAVLALGAIASTTFGYLNLRRARAAEARAVATEQLAQANRSEAEKVVNYLVGELREDLAPLGRLKLLDGLLQEVLGYYDHLPAALRSPTTELNQAVAYGRAAFVSLELGKQKVGDEQLQRAFAALDRAGPSADSVARAIARSAVLYSQSFAYDRQTRFSESIASAREALSGLEAVKEASRNSREWTQASAESLVSLGTGLSRIGSREAVPALDRSVELLKSLLAEAGPKATRIELQISRALVWSAYSASRANLPDQVESRAKEGIGLAKKIRGNDPSNFSALGTTGTGLLALWELYMNQNRMAELESVSRERVAVDRERLSIDPSNPGAINNLLVGTTRGARLQLHQGQPSAALQELTAGAATFRQLASTGSSFNKANLVTQEALRAEILTAQGQSTAAAESESVFQKLEEQILSTQAPDSAERDLRVEVGQNVRRRVRLTAGDFEFVRESARQSLRRLEESKTTDETVVTRQKVAMNRANQSLGQAAAEAGAWAEAESALRLALSEAMDKSDTLGADGTTGGSTSALESYESLAARRARLQTWLAWVCAHNGKAGEAVTLATAAREYQRSQLAKAGDADMTLRLAAAFAEIALARSQLAAGASATETRANLAAAEARIAGLPAEFRATTWVKQVAAKLEKTRALLP